MMKMSKVKLCLIVLSLLLASALLGGCAEILDEIERAMESPSSLAEEWNAKGLEHTDVGEFQEAIEAYDRALKEGLDKDVYYNNMCYVHNEMGQYEKAIEYIEKANDIDPESAMHYLNYGHSYYGMGMYDEALTKYQQAKVLDQDLSYVYASMGDVYYEMYEYDKAIQNYETYLGYEGDDYDIKLMLITCYYLNEDLLKANSYADEVIEEHPEFFLMLMITKVHCLNTLIVRKIYWLSMRM